MDLIYGPRLTYKNYTYKRVSERNLDGTICQYHYAVDSEGNETRIDYSQYSSMTEEAFKLFIDLKFPSREVNPKTNSSVPWDLGKLKEYKRDKEELEYRRNYTIFRDNLTDL